jgi:hypothetical protein
MEKTRQVSVFDDCLKKYGLSLHSSIIDFEKIQIEK